MCQAQFAGVSVAKGKKRTHAGEHLEGAAVAVK